MKKLEFKMIKGYNRIIALLLALLGFAGCEDINNTRDEYGTPSADFVFKGTIQSKGFNQAISGVRVILTDTAEHPTFLADTSFTNFNGSYELEISDFPEDKVFKISVADTDGTTNGEFDAQDTIVEIKNPTFYGGDGHWYSGKTTRTVDIKLIRKTE